MDDGDPKPKRRPPKPEAVEDVMLLHSKTEDGDGFRALRSRNGEVQVAEVRPAKEGQPLQGSELVALHPREQFPLLCDVEVLYRRDEDEPAAGGTGHEGPARVSSRAFRENFDRVFPSGRNKKKPAAN